MSGQVIAAIVGAAVVVGALVAMVVVGRRQHPENAADHTDGGTRADATGLATQPGRVHDRPAGPDAEDQAVHPTGGAGPAAPSGPPAGEGQAPADGPSERRQQRSDEP